MKRKQKNLTGNFHKCSIKKGDLVKVITGDNKGEEGKVLQVNTKRIKGPYLLVDKVNLRTHFLKKNDNSSGGFEKKESWINVSNVKKIEEKHAD